MAKKEKFEKHSFKSYQDIFNRTKEDQSSQVVNKSIYDEIYKFYKKNENLDINIERITLKIKIGHYKGQGTNLNLQLMVIALTILMNSVVQIAGVTFHSIAGFTSGIGCFIVATIFFVSISRDSIKSKSSEMDIIYFIRLQVLDDIEKENAQKIADDKEKRDKIDKRDWIKTNNIKMGNTRGEELRKSQQKVAVTKQKCKSKT